MVDDSHAVGFVGKTGRGTAEYCGVEGRVDIITGTLGKALGGASGGYTSGRKEIIDLSKTEKPSVPVLEFPGTGNRRERALSCLICWRKAQNFVITWKK